MMKHSELVYHYYISILHLNPQALKVEKRIWKLG